MIVKSGSDFKEYSIIDIYFDEKNDDCIYNIRNKCTAGVKFHKVTEDIIEDENMKKYVDFYSQKTKEDMDKVIGYSLASLDT